MIPLYVFSLSPGYQVSLGDAIVQYHADSNDRPQKFTPGFHGAVALMVWLTWGGSKSCHLGYWKTWPVTMHECTKIDPPSTDMLSETSLTLYNDVEWSANCIGMMTSSNGNIFRVTGPLCREFTGPGEFPAQRPVTRSFDVFFDLRPNKRLSKQPWGWWFETSSWSLWRQCNGNH